MCRLRDSSCSKLLGAQGSENEDNSIAMTPARSARVIRREKVVQESGVASLRRFKEDVTEVNAGFECGIALESFSDFRVGDIIEFYRKERTN